MNRINAHASQGQAMAEFVVMTAGCLLLLFILVPVVGKFSDMAYKAQELARYTAWERTVWYSPYGSAKVDQPSQIDLENGHLATRADLLISNTAEQRLLPFESTSRAFAPNDIDTPTANNRLWRWTHSGQAMTSAGSIAAGTSLASSATPSLSYTIIDTYNDITSVVADAIDFISFGGGDNDFLQIAHPTRNFYGTTVNIPVPLSGSQLGGKPLFGDSYTTQLNVGARAAVLADGWVTQSEDHFREKVDDFVLGTVVQEHPLWEGLQTLIGIFEPSFRDVNFAPVNTDPMPDTETTCNTQTGYCYYEE